MAGTRIENGGPQNTSSGYTVELRGYKRKQGWPRNKWMDIVRWDLKDLDTTWDEAEELAADRGEWHQRVAKCIHQDASWTKVLRYIALDSSDHLCQLLLQHFPNIHYSGPSLTCSEELTGWTKVKVVVVVIECGSVSVGTCHVTVAAGVCWLCIVWYKGSFMEPRFWPCCHHHRYDNSSVFRHIF